MGWFENQALKFGILAGLMQLGKAIDEQNQQEQQDVHESAPVREVQPQQPVQEIDTGRRRGTILDTMIRNGKL